MLELSFKSLRSPLLRGEIKFLTAEEQRTQRNNRFDDPRTITLQSHSQSNSIACNEVSRMLPTGTIHKMDCIEGMRQLKAGSVDLAFADPPFNIGYKYDVYDDRKDYNAYLKWSHNWIAGVFKVLKPTGSFWLAIGDEYAAELKIEAQKVGFQCRSWVIWYYTFGVNCKFKFSRSHVHIFHFVKDPEHFTFNREAILIPSARQLVYADKRAAAGRLPDDTWILRPQDLTDGFNPDDSVWYFPRVAGTFKEREGFHGCQMPEQLLGRIVKSCSNPGELVLDPFSGSATTVAVAKKLGRRFVGFDISDDYITRGLSRLEGIEPGDPLDGSAEPKASVAATPSYTEKASRAVQLGKGQNSRQHPDAGVGEALDLADAATCLIEAFRQSSQGYSADRVVADPQLNAAFIEECQKQGLVKPPSLLNRSLFRLRKSGKLTSEVPTERRTELTWSDADPLLFASEIAWRLISDRTNGSLDDILCNPSMAEQFDEIAQRFAPGFSSFQYRWAALKLRKEMKIAAARSETLPPVVMPPSQRIDQINLDALQKTAGIYVVSTTQQQPVYVGASLDLGRILSQQFQRSESSAWREFGSDIQVSDLPYAQIEHANLGLGSDSLSRSLIAHQFQLAQLLKPKLNRLGMESVAV